MQDLITRTDDNVRELCIRAAVALQGVRRRLEEERGQTAVEYAGILAIVGVIIAVIVGADIDGKVKNLVNAALGKVEKAGGEG
jgi:Flp pilus assembly pilin Flp